MESPMHHQGIWNILKRMFSRRSNVDKVADDLKKQDKAKTKKPKKTSRIRKSVAERKRWLAEQIEKAGYEFETSIVNLFINRISLCAGAIYAVYLVVISALNSVPWTWLILKGLIAFGAGTAAALIGLHIVFRIFIDFKKFQRKLMVEEVLPDFFQLASSNIHAGMPVDRALWFAVRPRFGVLAKEIEVVAKKTLSGDDLQESLIEFANKYDSKLVLRSVYLLNEGIKAGGNIGDLLTKVAGNLQEMKTMKKEMAANVTTYAIFITFAAIVAGPCLFGLSGQLLDIVQRISTEVTPDVPLDNPSVAGGIGISLNISASSISASDYRYFVYTCLTFSSVFSAMIVATIKKGNIREGIHYIPIYLAVSFAVFFAASWFMGRLLSGIV